MRDLEHADIVPLVRLAALAEQRGWTEDAIAAEIAYQRSMGIAWRWIGLALGTSGQAAWERYRERGHDGSIPLVSQSALPMEISSSRMVERFRAHVAQEQQHQGGGGRADEPKAEAQSQQLGDQVDG